MIRTLMLLRHAKAIPWSPGVNDFERELNGRGRRHAERLAEWLENHLEPPDRVLCSPSERTRGTLAPILERWPALESHCRYPGALYGASAGTLLDLSEEALEAVDSVLLVGHNPGFQDLAFSLLPAREAGRIHKMATGTLGVFEIVDKFEPGADGIRLQHWVRRKDLARIVHQPDLALPKRR